MPNSTISLLTNNDSSNAVDDYRTLLNQNFPQKINHSFREANSCTDFFVKMVIHDSTFHVQQYFFILDIPFMELALLLIFNLIALGCNTDHASMKS